MVMLQNYLKNTINKSTNKINIKNFWVVRQFKNEYNPVHYHDGNISGVGYLKIPKNLNFSKNSLLKRKKTQWDRLLKLEVTHNELTPTRIISAIFSFILVINLVGILLLPPEQISP